MLMQHYQTFNPSMQEYLGHRIAVPLKAKVTGNWNRWYLKQLRVNVDATTCNQIFSMLNISHSTVLHSPLLHPKFIILTLISWYFSCLLPPLHWLLNRQPKSQLIRVESNKFRMAQGWTWDCWMVNVQCWMQVAVSTFILGCFRYQLFWLPVSFAFRGTAIL